MVIMVTTNKEHENETESRPQSQESSSEQAEHASDADQKVGERKDGNESNEARPKAQGLKVLKLPENVTPKVLAENFKKFVEEGNVKWCVMVIMQNDGYMRYEWTYLPDNLAAVGAVEFLKRQLMEA